MDSHQRKKFVSTALRLLQDPEKAQLLRNLLVSPENAEAKAPVETIRSKIGTFWGSTPFWAVIGMVIGAIAAQISLKSLFFAAWLITLAEFVRVGFFENKNKRVVGGVIAAIVFAFMFYSGWKITPKPHDPPSIDQQLGEFSRRFPWFAEPPKPSRVEAASTAENKKPSFLYIAPAVWSEDGKWDFMIRHSGPDPVYNAEMVFADVYKRKQATASGQSLSINDLYQTFHFNEIDPVESVWAKQFFWVPVNPDDEEYSVNTTSREGHFTEEIRITAENRKNWQIAMKVTDEQTHAIRLHCRDPKFPVSPEFPKGLPKCLPDFIIPK